MEQKKHPKAQKHWMRQPRDDSAYNDMLLSCEEEISFGLIDEAITSD